MTNYELIHAFVSIIYLTMIIFEAILYCVLTYFFIKIKGPLIKIIKKYIIYLFFFLFISSLGTLAFFVNNFLNLNYGLLLLFLKLIASSMISFSIIKILLNKGIAVEK